MGRFRIIALAGTEVKLSQADQARFRARLSGAGKGDLEQMLRTRIAGVRIVHHGRRYAGQANRPARALGHARQRVRRMGRLMALAARLEVDQHPTRLGSHGIGRHAIIFRSRLAPAGEPVKAPLMPRASQEIAMQRAAAQGSAGMVAGIGYGAEDPLDTSQRERGCTDAHPLHPLPRELLGGSDIDPIRRLAHGMISPSGGAIRPGHPMLAVTSPKRNGVRTRSPSMVVR